VKVAMPKSKVRKKNDFTINSVSRTPVKVKAGPSSVGLQHAGAAAVDVRSRAMELRDRVRLHDRWPAADDALAMTAITCM
jgi:hypothetical protein